MTVFNARAVTIYLWHEIALILAVPLIDRLWDVPAFEAYLPLLPGGRTATMGP